MLTPLLTWRCSAFYGYHPRLWRRSRGGRRSMKLGASVTGWRWKQEQSISRSQTRSRTIGAHRGTERIVRRSNSRWYRPAVLLAKGCPKQTKQQWCWPSDWERAEEQEPHPGDGWRVPLKQDDEHDRYCCDRPSSPFHWLCNGGSSTG